MTDATFVARLQRNDHAEYDQLVDQYSDVLYRYIYESTRDHQQSAALLGAAFVRVVEQIDCYTPGNPPLIVWLYRIAHTLLRDTFIPAPHQPRAIAGASAHGPTALNALTPEERQVLMLRCVADMSLHEAGYVLAKSNSAVKQLQIRAMRAMHDWRR